jgi:hypothetical protein
MAALMPKTKSSPSWYPIDALARRFREFASAPEQPRKLGRFDCAKWKSYRDEIEGICSAATRRASATCFIASLARSHLEDLFAIQSFAASSETNPNISSSMPLEGLYHTDQWRPISVFRKVNMEALGDMGAL